MTNRPSTRRLVSVVVIGAELDTVLEVCEEVSPNQVTPRHNDEVRLVVDREAGCRCSRIRSSMRESTQIVQVEIAPCRGPDARARHVGRIRHARTGAGDSSPPPGAIITHIHRQRCRRHRFRHARVRIRNGDQIRGRGQARSSLGRPDEWSPSANPAARPPDGDGAATDLREIAVEGFSLVHPHRRNIIAGPSAYP